jgi:dATP/dGTP diphosphohydrolase
MDMHTHLPSDSRARKEVPICTGVLDYFPKALAAVARLSKKGNDKHNPGQPLHWSRDKSTDHADCLIRHQLDRGKIDPETGLLHEVMVAWRALAQLEIALERAEPEVEADGYVTVHPPLSERSLQRHERPRPDRADGWRPLDEIDADPGQPIELCDPSGRISMQICPGHGGYLPLPGWAWRPVNRGWDVA